MAKQKDIPKDISAEEKIKEAARKLFTEKGFDAVKTREIAEQAGINLALLNYYFRSKQKLYEIIMEENMQLFKNGFNDILGNNEMGVFEKIEKLVTYYIDGFIANRDLPIFIVSIINAKGGFDDIDAKNTKFNLNRKVFQNQIQELMTQKKLVNVSHVHVMSNLMSLVMHPFLFSPILKKRANLSDKQFIELMEERKKLIPIWMKNMFEK